jgi:predicted GNAT family acetyltransferase
VSEPASARDPAPPDAPLRLRNNTARQRYELLDGEAIAAFVTYRVRDGVVDLVHAETPPERRGRGLASQLIRETLRDIRREGMQALPSCPFVRAYIAAHPAEGDLVPSNERRRFGLDRP